MSERYISQQERTGSLVPQQVGKTALQPTVAPRDPLDLAVVRFEAADAGVRLPEYVDGDAALQAFLDRQDFENDPARDQIIY